MSLHSNEQINYLMFTLIKLTRPKLFQFTFKLNYFVVNKKITYMGEAGLDYVKHTRVFLVTIIEQRSRIM